MKNEAEQLQDLRITALEAQVTKLLTTIEEIAGILELQQELNKQVLEVVKPRE
jgi:hypothetical protein